MASAIRKAASKRGIDLTITARSEAEIENYIEDIDCLMVGPHLAYILDDIDKIVGDRDIKVTMVEARDYATFNGENALNQLLSLYQ
ncbi:MAG: cellobiose system component [Chloroflexota bacterium]|nr:cellobiose system component [Chloroflexota bacterium]